MAYTRHGHHIPGSPHHIVPRLAARCGGPKICFQCAMDVASYAEDAVVMEAEDVVFEAEEKLDSEE